MQRVAVAQRRADDPGAYSGQQRVRTVDGSTRPFDERRQQLLGADGEIEFGNETRRKRRPLDAAALEITHGRR